MAAARTRRWQKLLDAGACTSIGDPRILRLALLAPDVVEAILAGRTDQRMILEQLERPLPASWTEQRALIVHD
jgi:hypothetical protein